MTMTPEKTYRQIEYRLVPGTRARAERLHQVCRGVGRVWTELMHAGEGKPESRATMGKRLTGWLRESDWLRALPASPLRDAAQRLALAHRGAGTPRRRGRIDSFTVTQESDGRRADGTRRPRPPIMREGRLHVPKLGSFALRRRGGPSPHETGRVLRAVVRRRGRRWTATVCYEVKAPGPRGEGAVGVDMNARQIATSEPAKYHMPDIARLEARHRRYQRRMARQCGPVKGKRRASGRWRRTARRAAKCTAKAAQVRKHWRHQVTTNLAARFETVVLEDLSVKAMTASARGTTECPGRHVAQKAGLNRAILATGWGELRHMFAYKATSTITVNPAYTSQTCARCGHVAPENRRSQARFLCVACGTEDDADCNAGQNILTAGVSPAAARGGPCAQARPMSREQGQDRIHASHG